MPVIQLLLSLIVLGILYFRMIRREIDVPVDEDTFSFVVPDVLSCYVNGRSISYQVELIMFFPTGY